MWKVQGNSRDIWFERREDSPRSTVCPVTLWRNPSGWGSNGMVIEYDAPAYSILLCALRDCETTICQHERHQQHPCYRMKWTDEWPASHLFALRYDREVEAVAYRGGARPNPENFKLSIWIIWFLDPRNSDFLYAYNQRQSGFKSGLFKWLYSTWKTISFYVDGYPIQVLESRPKPWIVVPPTRSRQ